LQANSDPEARTARSISSWLREYLDKGKKPASEIYKAAETKFGECSRKLQRASSDE
jgi:hypothetical protein